MAEKKDIKEHVMETYSRVARSAQTGGASCCDAGCSCGSSKEGYAQGIGYSREELEGLPETVVGACAGCGNPSALAGLKEGEVVLDLGSGGGIDVFLAARKVGASGRAIGVDMTDEMIELARRNASEMGVENVEFRKGDIEEMPVEDETVDVIISNCVINLAPDKDKVFREAYRVLRPGGRLVVSDIVTDGELPKFVKDDPDAWSGCIAGALEEGDYVGRLGSAGFKDVSVLSKSRFMGFMYSAEIEAHKPVV